MQAPGADLPKPTLGDQAKTQGEERRDSQQDTSQGQRPQSTQPNTLSPAVVEAHATGDASATMRALANPLEAERLGERAARGPISIGRMLEEHPNARVISFGENHDNDAHREFMMECFGELKQQGFTHFFIEQIPANLQKALDEWLNEGNQSAGDKIRAHLEHGWSYTPQSAEQYLRMIQEAHSSGLQVVALSQPKKLNEIDEERGTPYYDQTSDNAWMAGHVQSVLQSDPTVRVITYSHWGHALPSTPALNKAEYGSRDNSYPMRSMGQILEKSGTSAIYVYIGGGIQEDSLIERLARTQGVDQESFMLAFPDNFWEPYSKILWSEQRVTDWEAYRPDYVIHLPETEAKEEIPNISG